MLGVLFALDKVLALTRQLIISHQFGFSEVLDAFNAANNLPDMLFALISGGALAIAFIPVLTETINLQGSKKAWRLFSQIANLSFVITLILAILIALFADKLVGWELGIAPGFNTHQQSLVIKLMRLNLTATILFSISGLIMASLQANQHFLLPALAPIMYNAGQIIGAVFFAPVKGYQLAGIQLPSLGLGVDGLVYGVILGAFLHLLIQIPGLIKFGFRWTSGFGLKEIAVRKMLSLMGPRFLSMLFIQLIFIVRDNLASRLPAGSVSALSYGYMIQQLPETLIGTAIGTAMLPALSELFSRKETLEFQKRIQKAVQFLIAATIPVALIAGEGLKPLLPIVFGLDQNASRLLLSATRGYLAGLTGHCLLEVTARSFYAQQNAKLPLLGSFLNVMLYILFGSVFYQLWGVFGISFTDSLAVTIQAIILLILLSQLNSNWFVQLKNHWLFRRFSLPHSQPMAQYDIEVSINWLPTVFKSLAGGILGVIICTGFIKVTTASGFHPIPAGISGFVLGFLSSLTIVWKDIRNIIHL